MESLEQVRNRKNTLYKRMKEANKSANETVNPSERRKQIERHRILRDMYREACDECARLEGQVRAARRSTVQLEGIFHQDKIWYELQNGFMDGADDGIWSDVLSVRAPGASTGRQYRLLTDLLNDAVCGCTERQKLFINEYFNKGNATPDIAEVYGIDRSTVSRVIRSGLSRIGKHVLARLTIASCIDDKGRFDYLKFCRSAKLLTPRQTELMYLALTQDASYTMMAAYIGRNLSTVSRTVDRVEARLRAVRVELLPEIDVSGVKFKDWSGIGEIELASRLGLSRKFFYTALHREETVDGVPMLHYHALCRLRDGWSTDKTAQELGVTKRWCKKIVRLYEHNDIVCDFSRLPPYTPDIIRNNEYHGSILKSLRDLTRGENELIDRIDGRSMARLLEAKAC